MSAAEPSSQSAIQQLRRMDRLTLALVQSLDVRSILEQALSAVVDVSNGECGLLYSLEGMSLKGSAACGLSTEDESAALSSTIPLGAGTVGEAAQQAEVRVGQLPSLESVKSCGLPSAAGPSNAVFIPLRGKQQTFGVLVIGFDGECMYGHDDLQFWENVGRQIGLAAENAQLFEIVRRSRGRFRHLVDTANAVIFSLDRSGQFTHFNDTAEELTGYQRQELIGRPFELIIAEDERDEARRLWQRIWAAGKSISFEFSVLTQSGEERLIHWSTADDVDDQEQRVGVVFVGQDISREKELEQSLQQAEKLAAIGTMISGVAHELNNPLTAVIGFAELLGQDDSLSEKVHQELRIIHDQGMRCREVVDSLLHFARKEKGARVGVDVNGILRQCLSLREHHFHLENIEVVTELDPALPSIVGDPSQLRTALLNVINNAFDVMAELGSQGQLTIRTCSLTGHRVCVEIEDTGGGVEHPERIFEPFYTTKVVGKGTGLGLSATYGIVVEHGGLIEAENTESGAVFKIQLPETSPMALEEQQALASEERPAPSGISGRILVVDDEPHIANLLSEALAIRGHKAFCALTVQDALKAISEQEFDAIVTDVRMPGERDGEWFYRWLEVNRQDLATRVAFVSGEMLSDRVRTLVAESGRPVLPKPFALPEFLELVDGLLAEDVPQAGSEG